MAGIGEGLALLSATSFAAGSVAIAKGAVRKQGDNGALLSVIVTAVAAGLVWLAFGPSRTTAWLSPRAPLGVGWFALSGLLTIVLGRALLFRSVEALGVVRASAVKHLNPFFSVLLAALVLGEVITPVEALGTGLIAASFVILVMPSFLSAPRAESKAEIGAADLAAYSYGPASALCYAIGYIARKYGLDHSPDPNLGTLVAALAGVLSNVAVAAPWPGQRNVLTGLLRNTTRWQFAAAMFISVGQLSNFAAIQSIEISRVAIISSLEVFIAMFLSVYGFGTEGMPGMASLIAALAAMSGAALVALG